MSALLQDIESPPLTSIAAAVTAPRLPEERTAPILAVFSSTESCVDIWPTLAEDAGINFERIATPEELLAIRNAVTVLATPGDEGMLDTMLASLGDKRHETAAVGTDADHRLAVKVMRAGAAAYFALPGDLELLRSWIGGRVESLHALKERRAFASGEAAKYKFEGILGKSDALQRTLDLASRVIPHASATVLLRGETGTGKELLARAIHYNGPRNESPFVDINCAAIPENLLESELFGHEKGSFTGAVGTKPGLFEVAEGGTIFLDEIGHLSLPLQGKLLRVLEDRSIRRVGGVQTRSIDVRVISASHVDLGAAARRGEFREDLYYRLNVLPIKLPPLRERPEDIPLLARHFISRFAREYQLVEPVLTPTARGALAAHQWPGNIRELRNVLERAVVMTAGSALDEAALGLSPPTRNVPAQSSLRFPAPLRELELAATVEMVRLCRNNKSEAARRLRISRTRLLRILDRADPILDHPGAHHDFA